MNAPETVARPKAGASFFQAGAGLKKRPLPEYNIPVSVFSRVPGECRGRNGSIRKSHHTGGNDMEYRKFGDTFAVRIDRGEEIMESLKKLCVKENIRLAQVDALGAAEQAVIGVYQLAEQQYRREEINEFMEITSLTGNVTSMNGEPYLHLHGTLAGRDHVIHGGHVLEIRVGATCEMFVRVLEGEITREKDEKLGINLWHFGNE